MTIHKISKDLDKMSVFKKLTNFIATRVGAKNVFPYTLGDCHGQIGLCRMYKCTKDSKTYSAFIYEKKGNPVADEFVLQQAKKMKTLRHPQILKYEFDLDTPTKFYMVTEECTPLSAGLTSQDEYVRETVFSKCWGLYQVLQCLSFLHQNGLFHLGITPHSVFVVKCGNWKLGGFGFSGKKGSNSVGNSVSENVKKFGQFYFSEAQYLPPEIQMKKWNFVGRYPGKVDSYFVGSLMEYIFSHGADGENERMPKSLAKYQKQFCDRNPSNRTEVEVLLQSKMFQENELFQLLVFVENLHLIPMEDSDDNARRVAKNLSKLGDLYLKQLPVRYCVHKILPNLFQAVLHGGSVEGTSLIFKNIFRIGNKMSCGDPVLAKENEYLQGFMPEIIKIMKVQSSFLVAYRIIAISHMKQIVEKSVWKDEEKGKKYLEKTLFPIILQSFGSPEEKLREVCVKSLVHIIRVLSPKTIVKSLIPTLLRLLKDPKAGIRANSIIAVGLIAKNIPGNVRLSFLMKFFVQSLKDTFVPSKVYTIRALLSTKQYFDVFVIAKMVIPMIAPLTISSVGELRNTAFFALEAFFSELKQQVESGELEGRIMQTVKKLNDEKKRKSESYLEWAKRYLKKNPQNQKGKNPPSQTEEVAAPKKKAYSKPAPLKPIDLGSGSPAAGEEEEEDGGKKKKKLNMENIMHPSASLDRKRNAYIQDSIDDFLDVESPVPPSKKRSSGRRGRARAGEFPEIGNEDILGEDTDNWEDMLPAIPTGDDDDEDEDLVKYPSVGKQKKRGLKLEFTEKEKRKGVQLDLPDVGGGDDDENLDGWDDLIIPEKNPKKVKKKKRAVRKKKKKKKIDLSTPKKAPTPVKEEVQLMNFEEVEEVKTPEFRPELEEEMETPQPEEVTESEFTDILDNFNPDGFKDSKSMGGKKDDDDPFGIMGNADDAFGDEKLDDWEDF